MSKIYSVHVGGGAVEWQGRLMKRRSRSPCDFFECARGQRLGAEGRGGKKGGKMRALDLRDGTRSGEHAQRGWAAFDLANSLKLNERWYFALIIHFHSL